MSQFIPDMRQGDTYPIRVEYPYGTDITGYKFWFTVKRKFTDPDADAVIQITQIAEGADAEVGLFNLIVPPVITSTVLPGEYYWDVQVKTSAGGVKTLCPPEEQFDDRLRVIPQVTQATA